MYLKALEIQGFKSFPDKVLLPFEKDITAIVGPNGSGKSNISDAILWVMGEQRTKTLRGGKMEDVIFGGTEKRPKMGFAQVSLILDNSDHIFSIETSEVMITRRYYRSGESEYYINRESVRLKDITDLLMDTGLGRFGYSIIGQGKISEVVAAKSGDRRELFEEAAGISRYRCRKDESERKLGHTQENLVRINDKIDELKIQVDPLREQAEVAKKYLVLRDELRLLEVSVWMETLEKLQEKNLTINADYENAVSGQMKSRDELEKLYAAAENFSEKMREKDLEAEQTRDKLTETDSRAAEIESEIAVVENTRGHNAEREKQLISEIDEQATRARALENQIAQRQSRVEEIKNELELLDGRLGEITAKLRENAAGGDDNKKRTADLLAEKGEKQTLLAHCSTVLTMLADSQSQRSMDADRRDADAENAQQRYDELSARLKTERAEREKAKEKTDELSNVIAGYKMRMEGRESKVRQLEDKKTALTIELNSTHSRFNMLSEMEKEYEGYSGAVKTVMREAERGLIKGVHGPIANLVHADNRFSLAVETALGASMQSIVVDTQEQGKTAIEMLKRQNAGRATFLPIATIRGSELKRRPDGEPGFLGTAYELASFDKKYEAIFSNLLSRTVVAETLGDAVAMSKKFDHQLRIVTLDGQMINAGGSMSGGSAAKNSGILSRANEVRALGDKLKTLEADAADCAAKLTEAARELASAKYEMQTAEFELSEAQETLRSFESAVSGTEIMLSEADKTLENLENAAAIEKHRREEDKKRADVAEADAKRLEAEIAEIDKKLEVLSASGQEQESRAKELADSISAIAEKRSSLIAESDTTENAIEQLGQLYDDLLSDGETRRTAIEELSAVKTALDERADRLNESLEKMRASAETIRAELAAINDTKLQLEGLRTKNDKAAQDKNRELLDIERLVASIEQKMISAEMEEKQIIDKLWDSYELSRTAANQMRQPVENLAAAQKRIGSIRREISSLGTPNLGAIEEYDRVSERYNFLTEQRDDVEKAKKELESIIDEITGEMTSIFRREFDIINESFRTTFLELFGGGRAALLLEDENDILNCGIEIKVQPPGKALTTLSLLSGGETAFVAIALYFAILKVRPAPFCVMDEIEAALDESNVDRYAAYMRTLTGKTQFLVITHRRGTMEEADMLYGVTMQEKGVSQVISIDLGQAEKAIAN